MSLNTAPSLIWGTGKVTTAIGTGAAGESVTVQADGKILVAGYALIGSNADFALVRYNTNGSLDTRFGTGGKVTTAIGNSSDYGESVTVQTDDKILVAGDAGGYFGLVRYNTDGSLDTSFDGDGKVTTDMGSDDDRGHGIALQADEKILVAGDAGGYFGLVRYNTDGSLDTSFDGDGKLTTKIGSNYDEGTSVVVQTDRKILVTGETNSRYTGFGLVRYNSDGSLDTSFDGDGKVTTDMGSSSESISLTLQPDGKILVVGYSLNSSYTADLAVVRYNSDGTLDTSFSGDGKVTTAIGTGNDWGQSVTVQVDGKILVAGYSWNSINYDFALVRYNTDGSLDASFDGDGKVTTAIGNSSDYGESVTVQADGKILVAGYYANASGNSEFALVRYNSDGSLDQTFSLDQSLGYSTSPIAVRYTENGSAISVGSGLGVFSDPELDAQGHYGGATLTVSRKIAQPEDQFSAGGHLGVLTEGSVLVLSDAIVGTVVK
ncbi:hypothetical protein FJY94_08895, partial [Candidatus Kaiserbacteria bacterium]|nr:hypothetical protein [Candidatus Kaiserbacteria bacterium]